MQIARVAHELGHPFMPWQRMVAAVGGEYEIVDGLLIPAYREVIVTVMRQSGKSTLMFSWIAHRMTMWPRLPQRAIYSAQDGKSARGKLFNDAAPMWEGSPTIGKLTGRIYRGVGPFEGVNWRTGSTTRLIDSGEAAGHGMTDIGLVGIDESFADTDDRREQATSPAMATQRDAQTLNTSTAGTDTSVFLRRKIVTGRAAAEAGETDDIAYFEWSIPDDRDVDDPETWWEFMPALGWTITPKVVAHNRRTMSDNDFRRSFCNQWTSIGDRSIPTAIWELACTPSATPTGHITFGVEVHPDRTSACVVAHGDRVVELVEQGSGVAWVVPFVVDKARRAGASVRVDGGGPAAVLIPDLETSGVALEVLGAKDVVRACGAFFDGLVSRALRVRSHPVLDLAAASVEQRRVGDAWAWTRRSVDVDVTPIMACSLAALQVTSQASVYEVRGMEVIG